MGQSIGIISLGKKLILIEGQESSLDKLTYGAILKNQFPEFVLVPVGGKDTLRSFDDVRDSILDKTIWGVDFFLLCDRDAVNAFGRKVVELDTPTRMRQLPRYHLENYFLDENILARGFSVVEPETSPLRDPAQIKLKLLDIARRVIPYAVALSVSATLRETVGNVSLMPKGISETTTPEALLELFEGRVESERARIATGLDGKLLSDLIQAEHKRLTDAVANDSSEWIRDLPGRQIFNRFAADAKIQRGRLKQLYLNEAVGSNTFGEIVALFESFRVLGASKL